MTTGTRPPWARVATLLAAYVTTTAVMTWPFVNYAEFADASYGGDARLIIWTLAWDNHALLTWTPLFDANVFFPATDALRYNEHLFGLSLFTLPWTAAGASPVLAYNATWWLAFLLNGLAGFAVLRRYVASDLAAFVGSLVVTYSFYVMLHAHGHLHLIWIWPLPLSMLLLERWFDAPGIGRLFLWTAVVLAGAMTSWYLAVMVLFVNGLMGLALLATASENRGTVASGAHRGSVWRKRVTHAALAVIVAATCLYPLARHYVSLRSNAVEAAAFSADVASYLVPPENTLAGRWWLAHVDRRPRSVYGEQTLFAGWIALALAAAGFVALLRGRQVSPRAWVFPLLALGGFLLSLGPAPSLPGGSALAPFAWLSALPGFAGMRAPARFAVVTMLGVAGLASIGAAALTRLSNGRIILGAAVPIMLLEWYVVGFPGGKPTSFRVPPIYLTPQIQAARSLVSLPEYREAPDWFNGADYLYFSTAHWRPIVNGFGRSEPPTHADVIRRVRDFPHSAAAIREMGVQYVVLHAARFPDGASAILDAARSSQECRLVATIGSDYLFEMVKAP